MFNMSDSDSYLTAMFETMGFPAHSGVSLKIRDIFTGEDCSTGREKISYSIPAHSCRIFRCTPVSA